MPDRGGQESELQDRATTLVRILEVIIELSLT